MSIALIVPLVVAGCGLVTSTVTSVLVLRGVLRFVRSRRRAASVLPLPPLSLLKPLHGAEPGLEEHLEGFFLQDYPDYEVLLCARQATDAGLEVAHRVAARHPEIKARFFTTGEPPYPNAKVASLDRMSRAAAHEILVVSDSDVRVDRGYLRAVAQPFAETEVGVVTCLYRGVVVASKTVPAPLPLWSQLEAVGMSVEMTAGVLVAELLEGMQFALGPTMAVRRSSLDRIGGFASLGEYCSDDFLLGNRVAAAGEKVVLSTHIIDHIILNATFSDSVKHQIRWMKSTRFSRPKGHLGTALTFATPYGVLAFAVLLLVGHPALGAFALLWSVANRALVAAAVAGLVVRERKLLRTVLLYPLRDLMGFAYWAASYGSDLILWRGEWYQLQHNGRMRRCASAPKAEERAPALTV